MKRLSIAVLALAFVLVAALVSAETIRQGGDRFSFNPTAVVVKTANYTLTTSDSEVDFNGSADVTATLPAIATSAYPGTKAYKIKQLSGTGRVIIAAASGSTIGGESQRVLSYKNAYIVISAGPNKDWKVDYESPITSEDYKYGAANFYAAQTATASTTFTTQDCGKTVSVATDSLTMTLPVAQAGCFFRFINTGAAGNNILDIAANSADAFFGTVHSGSNAGASGIIISSSTGSTLSNTKATAKKGDMVELYSPAATMWVITKGTGTWTTK